MQNIALIHVLVCRNFKQFCLLLCVHLDLLVVLFPRLSDCNVIIHHLIYAVNNVRSYVVDVYMLKRSRLDFLQTHGTKVSLHRLRKSRVFYYNVILSVHAVFTRPFLARQTDAVVTQQWPSPYRKQSEQSALK